jgi:hypothetical protein
MDGDQLTQAMVRFIRAVLPMYNFRYRHNEEKLAHVKKMMELIDIKYPRSKSGAKTEGEKT